MPATKQFILGDWHIWETPGLVCQVMASYEPTKRLHSFVATGDNSAWDNCINSLWLQGYKAEARELKARLIVKAMYA